jgi:hypothetical protein
LAPKTGIVAPKTSRFWPRDEGAARVLPGVRQELVALAGIAQRVVWADKLAKSLAEIAAIAGLRTFDV